jgi:hypothetical protein
VLDPTEIEVRVFPDRTPLVSTATGLDDSIFVAFPKLPELLLPQQNACPAAIAQAELLPTEMAVTLFPLNAPVVVTATGTYELTKVEFPSCPFEPSPQQKTDPEAIAQAELVPTDTDVTTFPANTPAVLTGTGIEEFSELEFPKIG